MPPQTFDAKVIKVFAAKDGEAIFRAYVVVWLLVSTSKSASPRVRNGDENAAGTGLPPDADAVKKMAAEKQGRNTTSAVAAWWWLNHNRESEDKHSREDKSS